MSEIIAISGSLRAGSFNRKLLINAIQQAPAGVSIRVADISQIPPYNADVEVQGFPAPVAELREQIRQADGLLIATPEYNWSIPGVLKNALDWVSRPPDQPCDGKPAAVMGASSGMWGTVRSQAHLRQVLRYLNMPVMPKPEILLTRAADKFNDAGELTDDKIRGTVKGFMVAFEVWVKRFAG